MMDFVKILKNNKKALLVLLVVSALGLYLAGSGLIEGMRAPKLAAGRGPVVAEAGGTCNCCTCGKISCSKCKRDFKKCCAGAGSMSVATTM